MSVSRSGILTLAVGLAVYAVALSHRARLNALVLGLIGLGVFRALVPGLLGTVRSLFRDVGTDPSIEGRTDDYAAIPGLMQGHWWFGRGTGTFLPDVYFFLDNQYLAALLQGGIVGLAAFIALLVVGLGVARGVRRRSLDPALRSEAQALAAVSRLCRGGSHLRRPQLPAERLPAVPPDRVRRRPLEPRPPPAEAEEGRRRRADVRCRTAAGCAGVSSPQPVAVGSECIGSASPVRASIFPRGREARSTVAALCQNPTLRWLGSSRRREARGR